MIDQTISNFKIRKKLGEGGMGIVYKAEDIKLDRTVAIKFLPREIASQEEVKKRFTIEAKAAAALNHPNIATIHQIEEADGELFIVMEYVQGQELRHFLKPGPVPEDEAIRCAIQIAEGLSAAHKKGVVHRDIKPANVMLTESGHIKIMDFGLAKLSGQSELTKEGTTMGTVAYMSPEQAAGQAVDHRTDIWSFGVILYEMLAGKQPFQAEYDQAIIYCINHEEPEPIPNLKDGGLEMLQQVVDRCLAKEPADRYPDMEEVLAELRSLVRETGAGTVVRVAERHTVGREKELAELQTALENAFSAQGSLLCVAGEPGIGKTTVVEQFLDEVTISDRPCLMAQGQCSERLAGSEALLPFLEVLESLMQEELDESVANLMREKAPWWYVQVASLAPDDPANAALFASSQAASQERTKRELVAFLQEISSKRPLILFFEDLHWADVSTIDMLAYLAPKFDSARLLIITTYRLEEMRLGEHPFLQIKLDLVSRGQCKELILGFLPKTEIAHYLALEYPQHTFPEAFATLIHDKTEGSPLFMADLLRDLQRREVIVNEEDSWRLAQSVEDIELELPDSVKGMIERKIQQLSEDDHRLMVAASVQGFEFDSAVVGKVLEMDEEEIEERLQVLERDHRFVYFTDEDEFPDRTLTLRYRFVHALYQNELYATLTRTKRARLSRTAAETLEAFYGEKSAKVAFELASLYETARDLEKAVDYLSQAAEHAASIFAYQEAIDLSQHGLELLKTLPESTDRDLQELSLQAHLGGAIVAIKGYGDADVGKAFTRARELGDKHGIEKLSDTVLNGLILYYNVTVQLSNSIELCEEILRINRHKSDIAFSFNVYAGGIGIVEQFHGNFASASKNFERGLYSAESQLEITGESVFAGMSVIYGFGHLAWNVWILGFPEQALKPSAEAKRLAEESRNPFNIVHYYAFAGFLYQCRGDAEKVLELSEAKYAVSIENAFQLNIAWANMHIGWVMSEQGDLEKGLQMLLEGLAIWRAVGMVVFVPYYHALIAEIYCKLNQPEEGLRLLDESFEIINKTDHRMWEAELHRIKGKLFLLQGETESEAEACYEKALAVARKQGAKSFELRAAVSLSRLWQSQGKNKQAKELLNNVYSWFTEGFQTRDLQAAKQLLDELS